MGDTFACMGSAITTVTSKLPAFDSHDQSSSNSLHASDKVVEAAWENGLGVHALIWVCTAHLKRPSLRV